MREDDPQRLADQLDDEVRKLERESKRVEDDIDQARTDWRRRQSDPNVPGANPPADDKEGQEGS